MSNPPVTRTGTSTSVTAPGNLPASPCRSAEDTSSGLGAGDTAIALACYLTSAVPLGWDRRWPVCQGIDRRPPRDHRRVPATESDEDGGGRGFQYGLG